MPGLGPRAAERRERNLGRLYRKAGQGRGGYRRKKVIEGGCRTERGEGR